MSGIDSDRSWRRLTGRDGGEVVVRIRGAFRKRGAASIDAAGEQIGDRLERRRLGCTKREQDRR